VIAHNSLVNGALKGFAAIRRLFAKPAHRGLNGDELRHWIDAQPDIADEARRGFEAIDAGRFRKVSRGQH
jgi:hypothetical protein